MWPTPPEVPVISGTATNPLGWLLQSLQQSLQAAQRRGNQAGTEGARVQKSTQGALFFTPLQKSQGSGLKVSIEPIDPAVLFKSLNKVIQESGEGRGAFQHISLHFSVSLINGSIYNQQLLHAIAYHFT